MAARLRDDPELARTTFVVIDFEGTTPTGFRPEPIDVALIHMRLDGHGWRYEPKFECLIKPPPHAPVTHFDTAQTGITPEMVADAAPAADVLAAADALMTDSQDYLLVAHNAHTEAGFINDYRHACPRLAHTDLLDTVRIARALYPQLGSHKLDTMLAHLDIPQPAGRHRAMPDVKVTAKLFSRMLAHADRTHTWTSLAQIRKSALIISKSNQPKQDSLFTNVEAQQ